MNTRSLVKQLSSLDILPLKVEQSDTDHNTAIYLFSLEAGVLHEIFEDIVLISTENVEIGNIHHDYPVWLFYSAKAMTVAGINTDLFKYES